MKYLIIFCFIFLSCTDDRSLDNNFEVRPVFEANVFQTQYSADLINTGNDSIPVPNVIKDYIDVDFFNEQVNDDYLETLEFKFLAENTINRNQTLEFVFFDAMNNATFQVTEPVQAGSENNPTLSSFSVILNPQEINIITSSIRAEITISQPSGATNSGNMTIECILEAGYLYTGE